MNYFSSDVLLRNFRTIMRQMIWNLKTSLEKKSQIKIEERSLQNLNYSRDHSDADGQLFVKAWNMSMLQSEDLVESAKAYMAKRKALFKNV